MISMFTGLRDYAQSYSAWASTVSFSSVTRLSFSTPSVRSQIIIVARYCPGYDNDCVLSVTIYPENPTLHSFDSLFRGIMPAVDKEPALRTTQWHLGRCLSNSSLLIRRGERAKKWNSREANSRFEERD